MQTNFTPEQLKDAAIQRSNEVLRSCVHCGFCTATCPTYQVLGDELVHYMHLVDHAREYIERNHQRRWDDRALRWILARILPYPGRFRLALFGAKLGKPFRRLIPDARLRAMLEMAPPSLPPVSRNDDPQVFPANGPRRKRVALMTGCAQRALNTDINDATIRLLTRHGCEVVVADGAGCCGALTHHMGKTHESHATASRNIRAWTREMDGQGLDAIVINTSGCGTTVKDYVMVDLGLSDPVHAPKLRVAYHAACSLQHGQQIKTHPKTLLKAAGFTIVEPKDPHLCCGSAGTYNLMQPAISKELKARKVKTLEATAPDLIAAGNIGCMIQIGGGASVPIVHTAELLDWATGGPKPPALEAHRAPA